MPRPTPLSDPQFVVQVAEAFAAGCSRTEMCEMFGVKDKGTITRWRRDARVKAQALRIIEDRVLQVTRKVDGVIAGRLEYAENMTITELLAIRKEFLGGALRAQTEKADEAAIQEAQEFLEQNPDAMEQLEAMLNGSAPIPGVVAGDGSD